MENVIDSKSARRDGDDVLMARYRRGDVAAFEELYQRYESRIYGFCLRFLGDPDAASDAFQDTFIRVMDARHRYEPRGRFVSWLFTIARRVCVRKLRVGQRQEPLDLIENRSATEFGHAPAELGEHYARCDELQRVLSALPPEQREVLVLSKFYDFTYGEIAGMVGSTEAAVKQKVYRALQFLRSSRRNAGTR